ncbi:MAG: IS1595 family transposase [Rhodospirillaceae bacterium]|nr:IS1595 family transposase [Rhodospirillaceae bacterium]MYB12193.1 IS1595 family transposase [Rhodospirillaceae bacterium]MYI50359.1 IS1595 family transposase [Rhodospirillaceae bacterium]
MAGKSYRKGLTLAQLLKKFPDDKAARKWFEEARWPNGPECPYCGSNNVQSDIKHPTMTHRCRTGPKRRMFSLKTGTVMQGSPLGYQVWAIAIYQMTTNLKSVSSMKLHRDLGISQKSAWFLAHRLREAYKADDMLYSGPAEVDESYFGGREANKHASKKMRAGRGAVGKVAVAGVRDRQTNRVSAAVVENTDSQTLHNFIENRVVDGAKVFTDDHRAYRGMIYHKHGAVRHSAGEYVRGEVHTQGSEAFWSMLKRAHKGTFHKISPKHMARYITEFTGRHNNREAETESQMVKLVRGMRGRRLKYDDLIADNGLDNGARSA